MRTYTVYMHIDKISEKKYIGITHMQPEKRWQNGNGYKNNKYFARAIDKHGWDGFEHKIIQEGLSKADAEILEINLIELYKTTDSKHGYNIRPGGDTSRHSEISKKRMSENHADVSGDKNPMYGLSFSEEHRRKIGEKSKGRFFSKEARDKISKATSGINNPMYGKTHSVESREIISKRMQGEASPRARSVINLNTGMVFNLIKNASQHFGIPYSSIVNCCCGRCAYAGKHPETGELMKWMYYDDYIKLINEEKDA